MDDGQCQSMQAAMVARPAEQMGGSGRRGLVEGLDRGVRGRDEHCDVRTGRKVGPDDPCEQETSRMRRRLEGGDGRENDDAAGSFVGGHRSSAPSSGPCASRFRSVADRLLGCG